MVGYRRDSIGDNADADDDGDEFQTVMTPTHVTMTTMDGMIPGKMHGTDSTDDIHTSRQDGDSVGDSVLLTLAQMLRQNQYVTH